MDDNRFDTLSQRVARDGSRRALVRALVGGAGSAMAGWLDASNVGTSARTKRRRNRGRGKGGVLVCHSGEELRLPRYAVRAILLDGGTRGSCRSGGPPGEAPPDCDVCPTCQFTTIQAAVDAARTGDVIAVCAGTHRETIEMPARDSLRGLLILGAGADAADTIIDGGGNGPVVVNPGGGPGLVLRRLTITGGNAEQGGGIFTRARALALIDVRVTGNRATLGGGGIFSAGDDESSVQLEFTDITNNEARSGGGIFHAGGGSISIRNESTIIGNRATQNGSGGGIHNAGGDVRLEDAVVRDNTPQNCFGVEGC